MTDNPNTGSFTDNHYPFKSFLSQQVTPFLHGKFGSQTDAACVILNRLELDLSYPSDLVQML